MFILMEDAAEAVMSVDVQVSELVTVDDRLGQGGEWSGVEDAPVRAMLVVVAFVLAQGVQQVSLVEGSGSGRGVRGGRPGSGVP
jgi:hypothetical protein